MKGISVDKVASELRLLKERSYYLALKEAVYKGDIKAEIPKRGSPLYDAMDQYKKDLDPDRQKFVTFIDTFIPMAQMFFEVVAANPITNDEKIQPNVADVMSRLCRRLPLTPLSHPFDNEDGWVDEKGKSFDRRKKYKNDHAFFNARYASLVFYPGRKEVYDCRQIPTYFDNFRGQIRQTQFPIDELRIPSATFKRLRWDRFANNLHPIDFPYFPAENPSKEVSLMWDEELALDLAKPSTITDFRSYGEHLKVSAICGSFHPVPSEILGDPRLLYILHMKVGNKAIAIPHLIDGIFNEVYLRDFDDELVDYHTSFMRKYLGGDMIISMTEVTKLLDEDLHVCNWGFPSHNLMLADEPGAIYIDRKVAQQYFVVSGIMPSWCNDGPEVDDIIARTTEACRRYAQSHHEWVNPDDVYDLDDMDKMIDIAKYMGTL